MENPAAPPRNRHIFAAPCGSIPHRYHAAPGQDGPPGRRSSLLTSCHSRPQQRRHFPTSCEEFRGDKKKQDERQANDFPAQQGKRWHAIATLPKILHQGKFFYRGMGPRSWLYIVIYCPVTSRYCWASAHRGYARTPWHAPCRSAARMPSAVRRPGRFAPVARRFPSARACAPHGARVGCVYPD